MRNIARFFATCLLGLLCLWSCVLQAQTREPIDQALFPFLPTKPLVLQDLEFPSQPRVIDSTSSAQMAVYKPMGNGPFPAVVLSPTCGGVGFHLMRWAKAGVERGYVVLILDHMTQRNAGNICGRASDLTFWRGTKDAYDALDFLSDQPYVDAKKVGLMGYSWGGAVAYFLASNSIAQDKLVRSKKGLRYAATVGVYPVCFHDSIYFPGGRTVPATAFMKPDVDRPVLALMGENDHEELTPVCLKRLENMKRNGQPVSWHVYPNTTHGWDNQGANGRSSTPPWTGKTGTFIFSEEVTRDSIIRAYDFLTATFKD